MVNLILKEIQDFSIFKNVSRIFARKENQRNLQKLLIDPIRVCTFLIYN